MPSNVTSKRQLVRNQKARRVVAYLRVSTDEQDLNSQKVGIISYAQENGLQPLVFEQEAVSGRVPASERRLGKVVAELREGDVLLVAELSRLGRNMIEIMTILKELVERGVNVFSVKENYRLDDSLNSKILSTVLCMVAEISRELTRARVKEGMTRAKMEGKKLGRPVGLPTRSKLDPHESEIRDLTAKGVSKASIAKIYSTTWQTVHTFTKNKHIHRPRKRRKIYLPISSD
jgi:DNA invertase Pin-like site-specific DNA recombinase